MGCKQGQNDYVYEENGESNAQHLTENLGSELITKDSS